MFATKNDFKNNIYEYQVDQITEGDDTIVLHSLQAATEEVSSYLSWNNKKEYLDGRLHYDVQAIFDARGENRNPLILNHVITVAKYWLIDLANVDILFEEAKSRYDRSIDYLKQLNKGEITLSSLPIVNQDDSETTENDDITPFVMGSRDKFNHE